MTKDASLICSKPSAPQYTASRHRRALTVQRGSADLLQVVRPNRNGSPRKSLISGNQEGERLGRMGGWCAKGLHVADLDTVTAGKAGELWIATGEGKGLERSTINQRRRHLNSTSAFIGNILLSKVDPRASEDKLPAKTISVRQRADEFGLIGRPKSIAGERSLPSSSMPSRNGSLPAQRGARAGVPRRLRQRREPREHRQPKLRSCLGGCWCCRRHWQAGPRRQSSPDGEVHRPSRLAALLRLIAHQSAAEVTRSRLRQTPTGTCSR